MGHADAQWRELCAKYGVFSVVAAAPKYILHFISLALLTIQDSIPNAWRYVDAALLSLVDVFRLGSGLFPATNLSACKRPAKPLILYEYEASPWCRRVREVLSVLRIDYLSLPCPRETLKMRGYCKDSRFRNEMKAQGKRLQFPYLDDPNTGAQLYESGRIMEYLWKEYGADAKAPLNYRIATWTPIEVVTHLLACCCRPLMTCGFMRTPSKTPESPLELFGCEASPCVRRVRETLSCLELPYLANVSGTPKMVKASDESDTHNEKTCTAATPIAQALAVRLVDPNTKTELTKASEIVAYLRNTYELEPAKTESWLEYGTAHEGGAEAN